MDKIALLDVDSKIRTWALMKIARFHRNLDDEIVWYDPDLVDEYALIYASKYSIFQRRTHKTAPS